MRLELIDGGRAQLEMEIVLKIAEPRPMSEAEFQELIAPLARRTKLALVGDTGKQLPLHNDNE